MNKNRTYHILDILRGTTVDGPGFRTAIYMAGCSHHCPGCHNPQSWAPDAGVEMTLEDIMKIVVEEDFDVTLTGGDPLYDPDGATLLAKTIVEAGYKVWLFTGFTIEDIKRKEELRQILPYTEAVVDGEYIENLRDPDLRFRGSSNQRIIYISKGN